MSVLSFAIIATIYKLETYIYISQTHTHKMILLKI